MTKRILAVGLTAAATLLFGACGEKPQSRPSGATDAKDYPRSWFLHQTDQQWQMHQELVGERMPDLDISGMLNGQLSTDDLKGKIVVVDFWATWCAPCLRSIRHNNDLYAQYSGRGVIVLGVCSSEQGQELMESAASEHRIQYPTARDPQLKSAHAWCVMWWPTYGVVDRKGVLRALGLRPDKVQQVVEDLLREQPLDEQGLARATVETP